MPSLDSVDVRSGARISAFHLEFLQPVLEYGLTQPMVDYLRWLASVLATRDVPAEHLALSLDWLADFFAGRMERPEADIVVAALQQTKARFHDTNDVAASAIYRCRLRRSIWPRRSPNP